MKGIGVIAFFILFAFTSCQDTNKKEGEKTNTNVLMEQSKLPLEAPPFDKIKDSDFIPAFDTAMKIHLKEIEEIANNREEPTFKNTLVALEKSGQMLSRVEQIFGVLTSANTNAVLQKADEVTSPLLAAHYDAIYLNDKLFQRVKTVYEQKEELGLDSESLRLVGYYYDQFVRQGANLSNEDKEKLKKLNMRGAELGTKFVSQLLAATKAGALTVEDTSLLNGLSEAQLKKAKQDAESRDLSDQWVLTLQNTTQQPLLQNLNNRETRIRFFQNSIHRAEKGDSNDTRSTITEYAMMRAQKAKLLGFSNYAAWKLQDQMAKTPETVDSFLNQLIPPAVKNAEKEVEELQKIIDDENGSFKLLPSDWNYYAELIRKRKYSLDEDSIKPYFELNTVLEKGVFYAAHLLYGLSFRERNDLPVWDQDVHVYNVLDRTGASLGLFYCDYFKRDNKSGGAWMSNLVTQSRLLNKKPVIYNVANFSKPAPGEPALISFDDVITMFHEFGHALHGFFANQQYPSLSGTSVARDFVEFPSQFNEHWASDTAVFKNYAIHYETKEPMPQELVEKIKNSTKFNQGYMLTELVAAAALDMQWHTLSAEDQVKDVDDFELKALKNTGAYLKQVPPRYRSSYFMHIWGNGYAAGYYAYLWTEMLEQDAYAWFVENGGLTRENGQKFRDVILSKGNTEDFDTMFVNLTGREPNIAPMLEARGLTTESE